LNIVSHNTARHAHTSLQAVASGDSTFNCGTQSLKSSEENLWTPLSSSENCITMPCHRTYPPEGNPIAELVHQRRIKSPYSPTSGESHLRRIMAWPRHGPPTRKAYHGSQKSLSLRSLADTGLGVDSHLTRKSGISEGTLCTSARLDPWTILRLNCSQGR
jgi:hypothetical protein